MKEKISADFLPAVEHLEEALSGIRTGRANPGIIEHVKVDMYGSSMRIKDMATISVPEPQTLQIEPWDASAVAAIDKAIKASDIGIQPNVSGKTIRLNMPQLTEERRKEMAKMVKRAVEECHIAIRNVREKLMKELKALELSEDEEKTEKDRVQKETDAATAFADLLGKDKERDLLSA